MKMYYYYRLIQLIEVSKHLDRPPILLICAALNCNSFVSAICCCVVGNDDDSGGGGDGVIGGSDDGSQQQQRHNIFSSKHICRAVKITRTKMKKKEEKKID